MISSASGQRRGQLADSPWTDPQGADPAAGTAAVVVEQRGTVIEGKGQLLASGGLG